MAAKQYQENLPLVLLHRLPSLNLPYRNRLSPHFLLLDPADSQEPISSFLSIHANSVRALLCVGYTPITSETLSLLPSLELIVAGTAGVDHIDLQECHRRGINITNASVAFAEDAADHAVALLIDVLRRISPADRFVRGGSWPVMGDYPLGSKVYFLSLSQFRFKIDSFLVNFHLYRTVLSRIYLKKPIFCKL